jgi:hypothetical protein
MTVLKAVVVYKKENMFDVFRKYINEKATLTDKELEMMEVECIPKKLRKRQFLLQEGDVCRHSNFVAKGCLRYYRLNDDGSEHILRFPAENWRTTDRESYTTCL